MAYQTRGDFQAHGRLDELVSDLFRKNVVDADHQAQGAARGAALDSVQDFLANRKNLLGTTIDGEAQFRRNKIASGAFQELLTQLILETPELCADRGRREPKFLASLGDAAGPDNRPEVKKVVVVQPFHLTSILREILILSSKDSNCPKYAEWVQRIEKSKRSART